MGLAAILIACIVFFRTVFVQRKNKASDEHQNQLRREAAYRSAMRRGWLARGRQLHDSLLETCKSLENCSHSDEFPPLRYPPVMPSGLIVVSFDDDSNWSRGATRDVTNGAKFSVDGLVSASTVMQTPDAAHIRSVLH